MLIMTNAREIEKKIENEIISSCEDSVHINFTVRKCESLEMINYLQGKGYEVETSDEESINGEELECLSVQWYRAE